MNNTLQYYNQYAADFTADTQSSDMTEKYASFLNRVKTGGHILDLGCGSGRDSLQFLKRGYTVTSVDGSEELCRIAEAYTITCCLMKSAGRTNLTACGPVHHFCTAP